MSKPTLTIRKADETIFSNIQDHPDFSPPVTDKRKREYKDYKADFEKKMSEKGLGDAVEKITVATGIKKAVKIFVKGEDCGCDDRKHKLNNLGKTDKQKTAFELKNCPTEDQYNYLNEFFTTYKGGDLQRHQTNEIDKILTHVFQRKHSPLSCCYGNRLNEAKKIWKAYQ